MSTREYPCRALRVLACAGAAGVPRFPADVLAGTCPWLTTPAKLKWDIARPKWDTAAKLSGISLGLSGIPSLPEFPWRSPPCRAGYQVERDTIPRHGNTVPRGILCLERNTGSSGIPSPDARRAARDIALHGRFRVARCAMALHMRHRAGRGTWACYCLGRHNGARDTVPCGIPRHAGYQARGTMRIGISGQACGSRAFRKRRRQAHDAR